jgi:hypothetical protein
MLSTRLLLFALAVRFVAASQSGVCAIFAADLPDFCVCSDKNLGGVLNCSVALEVTGYKIDTIDVVASVLPCATPASMGITVYEHREGFKYTLASISAGKRWHEPIPGLGYGFEAMGFIADVGVFVDVEIDGNVDALELTLDVDLCGEIGYNGGTNYSDCASDWELLKPFFPVDLLDETFDFSDICAGAGEEHAVKSNGSVASAVSPPQKPRAPNAPVCCSECTNKCVWSGVQHECRVSC